MPSSISSSEAGDAARWRRFFKTAVATAVGLGVTVYAFVAIVDPWDTLPLSPGWQRAPMSKNQRFAYASLARSPKFDSLLVGTSTSRLLRPAALSAALGGRFANLSMNSATPYEQSRILEVFRKTHADIRTVAFGIDFRWCDAEPEKYFYMTFPEWMYRGSRWRNYGHIFSLYAVQEAAAQLAYMLGLRPARFDAAGYANFLPDDRRYAAARTGTKHGPLKPIGQIADTLRERPDLRMPALDDLRSMLTQLPSRTLKIVFFTPILLEGRPAPGSAAAQPLAACKFRIVELARRVPNTTVIDFMIDSPITREPTNYWDPLHYRIGFADRIVAGLAAAAADPGVKSDDFRILLP